MKKRRAGSNQQRRINPLIQHHTALQSVEKGEAGIGIESYSGLLPSAETVRERIAELIEEMRQLGVLLKTAEELEREQQSTKTTNADEATK